MRIIVEAHHYGVSNLYELAQYVQLSEEHVLEILKHYKQKHGLTTDMVNTLFSLNHYECLNIKILIKQRRET